MEEEKEEWKEKVELAKRFLAIAQAFDILFRHSNVTEEEYETYFELRSRMLGEAV
jgi:hypothetical protein